jgi:hypothetical protein
MRQVDKNPVEQKFRDMLCNLRYSACTKADIEIFKSRVVSLQNRLSLDGSDFKNVSIITARNQDKDQFNEDHSIQFAREVGENLHDFYSMDELSTTEPKRFNCKGKVRVYSKARVLTNVLREDLWNQPPFTSEHIPGRLRLCKGLPVLIQYNIATNLCITCGQEARVVGWTLRRMQSGKLCLEVVYLELISPPRKVNIPNLPTNVVPVTRMEETVHARLSSDEYVFIARSQIPILPNFSMTDYSAQGKTREYNVIDLTLCRSFQAMYTCLSRAKTLGNTLVLRDFDAKKMSEPLDRGLRQEFRELNYLDVITDLLYKGELADSIIQPTRWATITNYKKWRGIGVESSWHARLQETDELDNTEGLTINQSLDPIKQPMKRKATDDESMDEKKKKRKAALERRLTAAAWMYPVGPCWDSNDYSCAFDAWTVILHTVSREADATQRARVAAYGPALGRNFDHIDAMSPEDPGQAMNSLQDDWRRELRALNPGRYGTRGVEMVQVTLDLFSVRDEDLTDTDPCMMCVGVCMCPAGQRLVRYNEIGQELSIAQFISEHQAPRSSDGLQDLLCFNVMYKENVKLDGRFDVGRLGSYRLVGIIYYGDFHFIARVIDNENRVYRHDGVNGTYSVFEGTLNGQGTPLQAMDLS